MALKAPKAETRAHGVAWPALALAAGLTVSLRYADAQDVHQRPDTAADERAQRAYTAGDYDEARRLWVPQAENGDPQAQLGLGTLYDLGQGVTRDASAAYSLYLRAAEAGLSDAEFDVAVMRDTGDGAPHDAAAAALWYARAAAHGNRRAQYNLGLLYASGDGVPRNPDQAEAYFRAAAAALPAAEDKLAAMQRGGRAHLPANAEQSATLTPAQLIAPADGSTVSALASDSENTIELVWIAPAQTMARFFLQLMVLDPAGPREVFATASNETAVVAPLTQVPGRYAWRVYSIGRDFRHYAASAWQRFQVRPRD